MFGSNYPISAVGKFLNIVVLAVVMRRCGNSKISNYRQNFPATLLHNGLRFTKPIKKIEAQMFNKPKMIDRSTYLKLPTKPFLLVLLKRVLCSRCGLSSDKLPTENGKNELKLFWGGLFLFYITLASFSIPKTAPIANTAPITFLAGVQTNFELLLEVVAPVPVYIATSDFWTIYVFPLLFIFIWLGRGFPLSYTMGCSTPSTISPILKLIDGIEPVNVPSKNALEFFVKINFAMTIFFSKCWHKYTHNFLTFYSFEKTDRAWAKSFNSFLLPLKFIRSENVAMEHNVTGIVVRRERKPHTTS